MYRIMSLTWDRHCFQIKESTDEVNPGTNQSAVWLLEFRKKGSAGHETTSEDKFLRWGLRKKERNATPTRIRYGPSNLEILICAVERALKIKINQVFPEIQSFPMQSMQKCLSASSFMLPRSNSFDPKPDDTTRISFYTSTSNVLASADLMSPGFQVCYLFCVSVIFFHPPTFLQTVLIKFLFDKKPPPKKPN